MIWVRTGYCLPVFWVVFAASRDAARAGLYRGGGILRQDSRWDYVPPVADGFWQTSAPTHRRLPGTLDEAAPIQPELYSAMRRSHLAPER